MIGSLVGIIASSGTKPPGPLPTGRVAYFPGTVTSGNLVNSLGSNGIGTSLTQVTGNKGNAVSFNGTTSFVDLNFNSNPTAMTWAFWLKASSGASGTLLSNISYYATTLASFPLNTALTTGDKMITAWSKGDDYSQDLFLTTTNVVADGTWHFVTITYTANTSVKLYVDGVLDNSSAINFTISTSPFNWYFGRQANIQGSGAVGGFLNGQIDELSYYDKELSATEVADLMSQAGS
jgi:hypothetical protein